MPRWTFEKFPEADETLTTQMKSVGEAMAIGRTFKEALQKAIRSMEVKRFGLGLDRNDQWFMTRITRPDERDRMRNSDGGPMQWPIDEKKLTRKLSIPSQGRLYYVRYAIKMGWTLDRIHDLPLIAPWFLDHIAQLVRFADTHASFASLVVVPAHVLFLPKRLGYSDAQLANL